MTTGTRRNGTSNFGPVRPAPTALLGAPVVQAEDDRIVDEYGRYDAYGYTPYDAYETPYDAFAPATRAFTAYDATRARTRHEAPRDYAPWDAARDYAPWDAGSGHALPRLYGYQGPAAPAARPEPKRNTGRYTARHASGRGKAPAVNVPVAKVPVAKAAVAKAPVVKAPVVKAPVVKAAAGNAIRKRIRRIMPLAAVAATLAAGTGAAYGLGHGDHPRPAHPNTQLAVHGAVTTAPSSAAGRANGASAAPVTAAPVTVATATTSGRVRAPKHAKTAPRRTSAATPSAATPSAAAPSAAVPSAAAPSTSASSHAAQSGSTTPATTPAAVPTSIPAATRPAAPVATPTASASPTAKQGAGQALSCNLNDGLLPANVTAIVSFLLANGYSDNAAAGIAGNIYQESKGNPESVGSGGGGLIGWTPLRPGLITGNPTADLQTQLSAILTYNQGWSQFLPALNSAASPAAAADIYVTDFERAGIPAAATREASAQDVAGACGI